MTRFLVLMLTIGVASMATAQDFYTPAPSFSGAHPAVVRIVVPERDGTAYGSGSLVAVNESSGLIVTNWHVVRDAAGPIMVYFPDGLSSGAYLLRTDRDWDLAALAVRRPNVQPIPLSSQAPQPGESLTIAGYGSGSYRSLTGQCTQYVSPGGNQPFEMIELSAPARNGDSGGPILNSRGELAGVLFGSAFGRTTGSYCGRLRWFLDSASGDFQRISAQAMLAQQARTIAAPATTASFNNSPAIQASTGSANQFVADTSPRPVTPEGPIGASRPRVGVGPDASGSAGSLAGEGPGMRSPLRPLAGEVAGIRSSPRPLAGEGQGVRAVGHAPSLANASTPSSPSTLPPADVTVSSPAPEVSQLAAAPTASLAAPSTAQAAKTDQVRAILALVGAIALLYHAIRFLGWAVG